ncbi:MAG: YcxB family protein [Acidobacteria bacterium]|nr:YcxB family protein [Acidobacteriota bacterium]
MELQGTIDRALYAKALRRQSRGAMTIGILLAFAGAWGVYARAAAGQPWFPSLLPFFLGVVLAIGPEWAARSALRANPLLREPFRGTATDERFVLESAHGRIDLDWAGFHQAIDGPDLVLLYTAPQQFQILAPRFFASDADWRELRALVGRKVRLRKVSNVLLTVAVLLVVILVFLAWALFSTPQTR